MYNVPLFPSAVQDVLQAAGGVFGTFTDATYPWSVFYLAGDVWVQ